MFDYQHGTVSAYVNLKCRCAECRAASSEYTKLRRLRRVAEGVRCAAPDCGGRVRTGPYCPGHETRLKRRGGLGTAPIEHRGSGADVGYAAAHRRVERINGAASDHACVDCGEIADDWSFEPGPDHLVRVQARGREKELGLRYSPEPAAYVARCRLCHKRFDLSKPGSTPTPLKAGP